MSAGELIVSIIGDMSKLSGVFQQVQSDIDNFGSKMTSIGSSLSSVGTGMTAGITAPILAAGAGIGVVSKEAVDFQKGITQVYTLLPDASAESMGKMSQDVLNFSKDMHVTTDQVIPALYDAIGSGVPENNVFSFLEIAQKGAVGAASDVGTAVDTLTSITNAYGQENLKAADASDILFTGINVGKMSYDELRASLYEVVPTAASLKVSFSDITAALAAMTAQGTPTTVATAQLRQLLVELSKEGTGASETFKEIAGKSFPQFIAEGGTLQQAIQLLGDGFTKTSPQAEELQKKIYELADPTSGLAKEFEALSGKSFKDFQREGGTAQQALEMMGLKFDDANGRLSDMFGSIEAGNAILNLTGQGAGIFNNALKEMENSAGATDRAYAKMSETAAASLDGINADLQAAAVEMGEKFLPIIQDTIVPLVTDTLIPTLEVAVDIIGTVAEAFNKLPQPIKVGIIAFVAFLAALGPILIVAGSIVSAIGTLAAAFGSGGALAGAISFISGTLLPALSAGFGVIIYTVIPILIELLGALISPIGLVAVALGAFALAWKNNWFDIQGKAAAAVQFISKQWDDLKQATSKIGPAFSEAKDKLSGVFNDIKNIASTAFQGVLAAITEKMNAIKNYLSGINLSSVAAIIWNTFIIGLTAVLLGPYVLIVGAINTVKSFLSGINISSQGQAIWNTFLNGLKAVIQGPYNAILAAINAIKSFLSGTNFSSLGQAIWNTFLAGVKAVILGPYNAILAAINAIKSFLSSTNFSPLAQVIWNTFLSGLKAVIQGPYNAILAAINAIKSFLSGTNISSHGQNIWNTFTNGVKAVISNPYNAITGAINTIKSYLSGVNLSSAGAAIINSLKDGVDSKIQSVKNSINGLLTWIDNHMPHSPAKSGPLSRLPNFSEYISSPLTSAVSAAKNTAKTAGSSIISSISSGIKSAASSVYNAASSALKKVSSLLPHSPAEEGPFSTLPDWDSVFYTPMMESIKNVSSLASPLSNALSNVKSPISGSIGAGLQSVSNVSNSSTVVEGSKYSIGPISVRNDSDLEAIIAAVKSSIANDRRRAGIF